MRRGTPLLMPVVRKMAKDGIARRRCAVWVLCVSKCGEMVNGIMVMRFFGKKSNGV